MPSYQGDEALPVLKLISSAIDRRYTYSCGTCKKNARSKIQSWFQIQFTIHKTDHVLNSGHSRRSTRDRNETATSSVDS